MVGGYLRPHVITYEKFKNLVELQLTHALDEEIGDFKLNPSDPTNWDEEDMVKSLLFLTRKNLILFLENNKCDFFIIENYNKKGELYYPIKDGDKDADNLVNIIGERIFYDFANETLEIIREIYEEMNSKNS